MPGAIENETAPEHLLFIGNSHTYLHYMPQMLVKLVEADGGPQTLVVAQATGDGVSLDWHWHNQETRALLVGRAWDYVVLQDRSGGPIEAQDTMLEYGRRFAGEIRKLGARTVFYMTWANRRRPETQKLLQEAYRRLADETEALLAPVGTAWAMALKANAGLRLHHADNRHANPTGAYLSACVFYTLICRTSPEGLPGTLHFKDRQLIDLPRESALFLQRIAFAAATASR